jgi:hypothetical protein
MAPSRRRNGWCEFSARLLSLLLSLSSAPTSVPASRRERCALRSSGARSPLASPKRSAWPPRSGRTPGSGCSATIRACWRPAPPICAASGRSTASSALACRFTSPLKAGAALLAAFRGAAAPAHRGRWRMGRLAPDRLARLAVRRSGGRARRLWPDARRGGRIRRLVPRGLAARRPRTRHEDAREE